MRVKKIEDIEIDVCMSSYDMILGCIVSSTKTII